MKVPPVYPDYTAVLAPGKRRWGIATVIIGLISAGGTLWLWPAGVSEKGNTFWFWLVGFPVLIAFLLFSVRQLIYQVALRNRQQYRQVLQQETNDWWQRRSRGLPIEQVILLGPAGVENEHHLAALNGSAPLPVPVEIKGKKKLLCPQIFETDPQRREEALTHYLVEALLKSPIRQTKLPPVFDAVYWCGPKRSGELFLRLISASGWHIPQVFLTLNRCEDIDNLIDHFHQSANQDPRRFLCAGVEQAHRDDPAAAESEAGFAWIIGENNSCTVQRAEQQAAGETAQQITSQVLQYSGLSGPPLSCIALSKATAEEMQKSSWTTRIRVLQPWWGSLSGIAPFIAISLALLESQEKDQTCGWMSRDGLETNLIGVITVNGKH